MVANLPGSKIGRNRGAVPLAIRCRRRPQTVATPDLLTRRQPNRTAAICPVPIPNLCRSWGSCRTPIDLPKPPTRACEPQAQSNPLRRTGRWRYLLVRSFFRLYRDRHLAM